MAVASKQEKTIYTIQDHDNWITNDWKSGSEIHEAYLFIAPGFIGINQGNKAGCIEHIKIYGKAWDKSSLYRRANCRKNHQRQVKAVDRYFWQYSKDAE